MQLELTAEQLRFQEEVRAFVNDKLPRSTRQKVDAGLALTKEEQVDWQKTLHERGWMAPGWPVEYGGTGWGPVERHIFDEELAMGGAPRIIPFGVSMVAPVLMAFGSDEQKSYFLPRILASDDWWCQGYSEPGSGSDLASLSTRAVSDGDEYVINGAKTWTTLAQHADWMFCLVRTGQGGKPQEGISFLLIDMKTPGISVRPITTMDGGHEVNTVFFEDVRVPITHRVGEENKGWTYAKFLLGHERTNIAAVGRSKWQLGRLRDIAAAECDDDGHPLVDNPDFARHLASVQTDIDALEATVLRLVSRESAGHGPGPEASILKIKGTEIQQRLSELLYKAVGNYAHPLFNEAHGDTLGPDYAATLAAGYFNNRKTSIYGGSNEIQKNIIAKAVLRL
ncbi:MAG: pimeloyl-CoA dehydrogenase large subunit [Gammaproteobacteria bacterium]|nr:pimeloyl-CoA dehydrogenase large subunit [Gammaproteobacteria bacterium]